MTGAITPKNPSLTKKVIVAAIMLLMIVITVSLLKMVKPEAPAPNLEEKLTLVNTGLLIPSQTLPSFVTVGKITVSAMSDLKSQVNGSILRVLVENGQQVRKGDLLIEIDPKEQSRHQIEAQAQFAQAQANLEQGITQNQANIKLLEKDKQLSTLAARSLERYQNLLKRNLATEAQVDQANEIAQRQASSTIQRQATTDNWPTQLALLEALLQSAQARLDQAVEDMASTQVIAPFNATVGNVMVGPAGRVAPGMTLINLFDQNQLVLEASIPQTVMNYLHSITTDTKTPNLSLNETLTATGKIWGQAVQFNLKAISQSQSAAGGSIGFFEPADKNLTLPVNRAMVVTISIPLLKEAFDIPIVALHDHKYIYRLNEDNILQRQDVVILGATYVGNERRYLIAAGNIPPSTTYVTSQMTRNVNGMKVQPATNSPVIGK